MKVLLTGARGFVGQWLCRALLRGGHTVLGGDRSEEREGGITADLNEVAWCHLELEDPASLKEAMDWKPEGIVHLAAIASGAAARRAPEQAWRVNCLGTSRLVQAVEESGRNPRLILASTGEVYGAQLVRPARESDPVLPCSPYAASKAGAEIVVLEAHRRWAANVVVARPFAQTGPGQRADFVAPAFAAQILRARASGVSTVQVGNLTPIREFLDVRDVADALVVLLERGVPGGIYNVSSGRGVALEELLQTLAQIIDWPVTPATDPSRLRTADIPYLVGDGTRLRDLGWSAKFDLESTLRDLVSNLMAQMPETTEPRRNS